jgi:hypothetical protein
MIALFASFKQEFANVIASLQLEAVAEQETSTDNPGRLTVPFRVTVQLACSVFFISVIFSLLVSAANTVTVLTSSAAAIIILFMVLDFD